MASFSFFQNHIDISTQDPDEILFIKQIRGREYKEGTWVVPLYRGIAAQFEKTFGPQVAAMVEEKEKEFLALLQPSPVDPWKVSAGDAIGAAITEHFYNYHGGDEKDYNLVHGKLR